MFKFSQLSVENKIIDLNKRATELFAEPNQYVVVAVGSHRSNLHQVWFTKWDEDCFVEDKRLQDFMAEADTLDKALDICSRRLSVELELRPVP